MANIKNVFSFLKDYNEISNPVITEINKQKWNLNLLSLPKIKEVWCAYNNQNSDAMKILEVERPVLKPCPSPDKSTLERIENDWKDLSIKVITNKAKIAREVYLNRYTCKKCDYRYNARLIDKKDKSCTYIDFNDVPEEWVCPNCGAKKSGFRKSELVTYYRDEFFNEDASRVNLFNEWIANRLKWRELEISRQEGLNLYNTLFQLYSDIKKESEAVELVVGDGYIKWNTGAKIIDHPVLLQKVELEFDHDKPSFIIKYDELKTELYTPMLRVIPTINQTMLSKVIIDIENNIYSITDILNTSGLFKNLINILDKDGKYIEKNEENFDGPIIMNEPILFLRKRTLVFLFSLIR